LEMDDGLAEDLGEMTRSQVSFVLDGHLVASTWPEAMRPQVERGLVAAASAAEGDDPFEMTLDHETYVSLSGRLSGGRGGYLIQRSFDEAIAFLRALGRPRVALGLGVLLAAAVISFVGAARIAQPVQALVDGTRQVAAGDLSHRLSVGSGDELGELAGSFNEMASALAESREH